MKKSTLLLLLLHFFVISAIAQDRQVKGSVTDDTGTPVEGANVVVKGSTAGTATLKDGSFTLRVNQTGSVELVISSRGYLTNTITVNGNTAGSIKLAKEVTGLEDVVVIGYGTAKRKDLTGTISSISGAQLEKIPVSSAAEAITGRLPGVQVTTVDGQPGAEIVIRVRGGGSVTQDNSPLYIVDGFPVPSINDIAPSDIASIDVMKDAATAAIYGARGANGVVIVTTKSAKGGRTVVSYTGFMQARTLPKKLDVLSPYQYTLAQYEWAKLRNDTTDFTKYFGAYGDLELYKLQAGTDWQEELYGKPIISQQHNLNVSGGNEKTKFGLNASQNKEQGLMPGSGYERQYLNFKLSHDIAKGLRLDIASRFSNAVTNGAGTAGGSSVRIGDAISTRPVNGIADHLDLSDAGSALNNDDYEQFLSSLLNPIQLTAQDYRKRVNKTLNMSAAINWTIIEGLVARSDFSYNYSTLENKRYFGPLTGESKNVGGNLPLGELTNSNGRSFRWSNTLTYSFKLGEDHSLSVMGGQELNKAEGFSDFSRAKFFTISTSPDQLFSNMARGTADGHTTTELRGENLASFFGRAFYSYKDKYLLTFTTRYDASSNFSPSRQWGIFPAASAAWRVSKEDFMDNVRFVDDLKFRVSYGSAGNNRVPTNSWRQIWFTSVTRPYGWGDVNNPYFTPGTNSLPNQNIKWETTITRNAGLDFSLFKNRVTGSLDVYWNTTKDLLVQQPIPQYTGYPSQTINIGQTSNRGVELGLSAVLVNSKDFNLSVTFNAGINRARIDDLGGPTSSPLSSNWASTDLKAQDDYLFQVGKTIGLIYGFVTDGFYTADDFESYNATTRKYTLKKGVADDYGLLGTNGGHFGTGVRPGFLKLKDIDGDGFVTADKDRQVIGSALPKAQGGFGANTSFKDFDFSVFFNWVYGNDVYNTGKIQFNQLYRTTFGNMLNTMNYDNRFKYIDAGGNIVTDLAALAELNKNANIWSPFGFGTATPVLHSWAIEDGSFIRLNNVTLGYSLPRSLISKAGMTKFRVYATVYNAFLITKYTGYDPEVSTTRNSGYSQLTPGVDYSAFPKGRTFTFGLNVTF
jgi:TonB-dependent starch-binding outer membrane protein SusC